MLAPIRIFAVALAIGFSASQASATTARLQYVGGSSAEGGTGGSSITANVGDLLSFAVFVDVGSAGVVAIAFGLQWFDDANMALDSTSWATGTALVSISPLTTIEHTVPLSPVVDSGTGTIANIGYLATSPAGPFTVSTTVFMGTVVFEVLASSESVVQTGFFNPNYYIAENANFNFFTPDFDLFTVNPAPEVPSVGTLGLGFLVLTVLCVGQLALRQHAR